MKTCNVGGCGKPAQAWHDRFGIFSGYACHRHEGELPGRGAMADYEPEEDIEPEDDYWERRDREPRPTVRPTSDHRHEPGYCGKPWAGYDDGPTDQEQQDADDRDYYRRTGYSPYDF